MTLSPDQIRDLCTSKVFDRAVTYRDEDRIGRLERFGGTVGAEVQGSQPDPYEIEIEGLTDSERVEDDTSVLDASCTCPYDWGGYCKHIVAVLLELAETAGELEDEREAVERVLSDVHSEELQEFLLAECERSAELRRRLLTRFEQQEAQSLYDYKSEMRQQYRNPYTYQYEGPELSEFHDLAEGHRLQGAPLEAATIYRAMTEVRIENMDMVQDYYGEDFQAELDSFLECIREADLDHEDRREYIEYLFERWAGEEAAVGTFSEQYLNALWELCTEDADLRYWRDLLEAELPTEIPETSDSSDGVGQFDASRYEAERRIKTHADVLDALGDTETLRETYERYYLDIQGFCPRYARLLAEEGDIDRAIAIAEEGLDTFSDDREIRHFLIDAYADRDSERYEELLQRQFLQSGDWEYYERLRSHCSDDEWDDIVVTFESQLAESNVHRLIDLYLREGRTTDAFDAVIEAARNGSTDASWRPVSDNGLSILSDYRRDVADYDPKTYYEVYEERLDPFLAETTGRSHYQTVVEYLEEMREFGFDDEFEGFLVHLKEKHSNRPAFLDEMEALDG
jgi:hypothetical protein